jgi:hypothetical protein
MSVQRMGMAIRAVPEKLEFYRDRHANLRWMPGIIDVSPQL